MTMNHCIHHVHREACAECRPQPDVAALAAECVTLRDEKERLRASLALHSRPDKVTLTPEHWDSIRRVLGANETDDLLSVVEDVVAALATVRQERDRLQEAVERTVAEREAAYRDLEAMHDDELALRALRATVEEIRPYLAHKDECREGWVYESYSPPMKCTCGLASRLDLLGPRSGPQDQKEQEVTRRDTTGDGTDSRTHKSAR
jgi:hypothetical protein